MEYCFLETFSVDPVSDIRDQSKNPFSDEVENEPTNPFSEVDDYDKNCNPFADDAD